MPIRFRCVYCDKLLGIARRKAGAVVSCPHCAEKLIVPTPEPDAEESGPTEDEAVMPESEEAVAATGNGMRLFEHSDFDAMMQAEPTFRNKNEPDEIPSSPKKTAVTGDALVGQLFGDTFVPEPPVAPAPPPVPFLKDEPHRPGYFVSPAKATWLSVAAVVLLALFFGLGVIVGRSIK
jgi:phage FluMu protein Com